MAAALFGGGLALVGLFLLAWWRLPEHGRLHWDLLEFAAAPQSHTLLLLFVVLMAVVMLLTRAGRAGHWPPALAALFFGLLVPLAYVLILLAHWAQTAAAFTFMVRAGWSDILLFCLPFAVAAEAAAWLWDRLP